MDWSVVSVKIKTGLPAFAVYKHWRTCRVSNFNLLFDVLNWVKSHNGSWLSPFNLCVVICKIRRDSTGLRFQDYVTCDLGDWDSALLALFRLGVSLPSETWEGAPPSVTSKLLLIQPPKVHRVMYSLFLTFKHNFIDTMTYFMMTSFLFNINVFHLTHNP